MASYWCCASRHVANNTGTTGALKGSRKATSPFGGGPDVISDPVGQAKSVTFSVEGKAKAAPPLQALFRASD